jgi:hypothetical protein
MNILGVEITKEDNNGEIKIEIELYGKKFAIKFTEDSDFIAEMIKLTILKETAKHIYNEDKNKKNGKYCLLSPLNFKSINYKNKIACVWYSSPYGYDNNTVIYTDNEDALRFK